MPSSFTTVSSLINITDALRFQGIDGFYIGGVGSSDNFRMSFDNLLMTAAVPEPPSAC